MNKLDCFPKQEWRRGEWIGLEAALKFEILYPLTDAPASEKENQAKNSEMEQLGEIA